MRIGHLFFFIFLTSLFSSCKLLYPNYLFRDTKDFVSTELAEEVEQQKQVILPDDRISFTLYTRDGINLVDPLGGGTSSGGSGRDFLVKSDGYVELPLLGELYVKGLTRLELENLLEEKYSVWYNDLFIQLTVTNRRIFVFAGVGSATLLGLPNENTTMLEVIAMLGGLGGDSKSDRIKLIRGSYDNPSIKRFDFSTIAGLKDADFIVQPNDIIVISARLRPGQRISSEIYNFYAIFGTIMSVYFFAISLTTLTK